MSIPVRRDYSIEPEEIQKILKECANRNGLKIVCSKESNTVFHVHIYQEIGDSMADRYIDESKGPSGAKSFGRDSIAKNIGEVSQTLSIEKSSKLADLMEQLLTILDEAKLPQLEKLNETRNTIREIVAEAHSEKPKVDKIYTCWNKARSWITKAIDVGVFISNTTLKLKDIIEKIKDVL